MRRALSAVTALLIAGCTAGENASAPGEAETYSGIGVDETIEFTGTEPFWGGQIANGQAVYSTPDNVEGISFPVERFAGNSGLSFSGTMAGARFDMTVTPGDCSDGMSDRTYPFTVTLLVGDEQRTGCGWTERQPFAGPESP